MNVRCTHPNVHGRHAQCGRWKWVLRTAWWRPDVRPRISRSAPVSDIFPTRCPQGGAIAASYRLVRVALTDGRPGRRSSASGSTQRQISGLREEVGQRQSRRTRPQPLAEQEIASVSAMCIRSCKRPLTAHPDKIACALIGMCGNVIMSRYQSRGHGRVPTVYDTIRCESGEPLTVPA